MFAIANNGYMSKHTDMDAVRQRLNDAIAKSNKSQRQILLDAGLGTSFLHGMLIEGKDPKITSLMKLCDSIGVSLMWVLYGLDASPEVEQILGALSQNPEKLPHLLALLEQ